jgi:hypothetical protein
MRFYVAQARIPDSINFSSEASRCCILYTSAPAQTKARLHDNALSRFITLAESIWSSLDQ